MRAGNLWSDLRDAIVGTHHDYTRGSVGRAVLLLAVPMVLEMSMQALFSVVDVFFVGRLGFGAVAIVGITDSLLALVFAVAMGLSLGTTAMVARRIGEGRPDRAASAAVQSIAVGVALSAVIGVLAWSYSDQLLALMGATDELIAEGRTYAAIMLGGNITVVLLFLINAVFRGTGDASLAMRSLWLANTLNIILDPLLIFGLGPIPALGLEGAAIATTGARGIGVIYQLYQLTRGHSRLHVNWSHTRLEPATIGRLIRVSAIGVLQFMISTTAFVWLFRILSTFGATAMAGYTIAIRVIIFILLPAWGMGNAAATLVGQNLGAGNPERAETSAWMTARCNTVFLGLVAVLLLFFATPVSALFSNDPAVVDLSARCLRIVSYSYVLWGFGMVTVLAFNGAGDTTTPTWINFIAYWLVQLPLAWILSVTFEYGPTGVFIAISVGQAVLAGLGVWLFRRGSWKTREI